MKKLRVGVLFGGRSGEHEISLLSAASVLQALNPEKYEIIPIAITKEGRWIDPAQSEKFLRGESVAAEGISRQGVAALAKDQGKDKDQAVIIPPTPAPGTLTPLERPSSPGDTPLSVDVIFPVLHGTFGEDGTIQGVLELADIPYVGAGVLGSAAGMDKDIMKRLFIACGLPIVKHVTMLRGEWEKEPKKMVRAVEAALKYPVFVKPANLGSSVGISKARSGKELAAAIDTAAGYDRKIVIEEGVGGKKHKARELECAVLGNDNPRASIAGEVVPAAEFYDYNAKYMDAASELIIPAKLTKKQTKELQEMAIRAFKAVDCSGLARVDFLMDPKNQRLYLNEINTMPGFTSISMYPKLWKATGLEYADLIDELIRLAMERYAEKKRNRYSKG